MTTDIDTLAKKFDKHGMGEMIERFPMQIRIALGTSIPSLPWRQRGFRNVVLAGMGGSASPMDVVSDIFCGRINAPVTVSRHYCPPVGVDDETLVIVSSFSGDTEEAISSLGKFAVVAKNIVVLTKGGALAEAAERAGVAIVKIPTGDDTPGFQPRSAVGYMVTYITRILDECQIIDGGCGDLDSVPGFLRHTDLRTDADDAAKWLGDRIPVVYTDEVHALGVARLAKIKFNENSKRPAMFGALPEANHNEMVGFTSALADFGVLYMHDPASHPMVRRRFTVMEEMFDRAGLDHVAFREWEMPDGTRAQKVFAALMYAERCSYAVALLNGIDPTPVAMVEAFKKEIGGGT